MLLQNFNRPAKEILLNLLNTVNDDDQFTIDNIDVGVLQVLDPTTQLVAVVISAGVASEYSGSLPVEYRRIDINQIVGNRGRELEQGGAIMTGALVPLINQLYSIQLTSDDVVNEIIMRSDFEQPYQQVVQISPAALIYYGQLQLTLL